jgi:hypothetical protein
MAHLLDTSTYKVISEEQAMNDVKKLSKEIFLWALCHRKSLTNDAVHYIRHHLDLSSKDPFGYFYLTVKLHRLNVSTRPFCSDCASVPHALGKWLDLQLQPIIQQQTTYFKDSYALKNELDKIYLPPNASIFNYDAVSMYTNIKTEDCINQLSAFLHNPTTLTTYQHLNLNPTAITEALSLVMLNNRMRFDSIIVEQQKGIVMGMSPAPTIANLYISIFKEQYLPPGTPRQLSFLQQFIDDGLGIWLTDPDPTTDELEWERFKKLINSMGLTWEFTTQSTTTTFMDLTISIERG